MEIESYNWGDETTNQVGICIRDGRNKIMVWCDEEDWEMDGCRGSGRVYDTLPEAGKTGFALGEALYIMLGGYR